MGIIVNKNQDDTKLGERITADLRDRVQSADPDNDPDFAEDNEYTKHLKQTGKFSWIWIVLIVLALIALVCIILI